MKKMKKETPQAYIKRLQGMLQMQENECQRMYLHEPSRIYKIGDRVQYGNWKWNHILEVFDGGKYYKLLIITSNVEYGVYKGETFEIRYLPWTSLLPYRTLDQRKSPPLLIKNQDLLLNYSQRDISGLIHMYYRFGLDLNPDYQRGNVWEQDDKVLLINSIFKNIDIGKFTIIKREFKENNQSYEILDGKQRVITLLEFFEDKFEYKGLKYSELHWRDQNHFSNYNISYAEASPMSHEQKYRYFLNLNVAGKPVDPDHIRHVRTLLFISRQNKKIIEDQAKKIDKKCQEEIEYGKKLQV
jgi:Protein of unknown function DUF262